jgi:hypothetical protein
MAGANYLVTIMNPVILAAVSLQPYQQAYQLDQTGA